MPDIELPNLMPYQEKSFNGDFFIEQEFIDFKKRFGIKTAVELGTCLGSTAIWLAKNFDNVITIEINKQYAALAQQRFLKENLKNIILYIGDTVKVLPEIIKGIGNDSIWFIDSHWNEHCPLEDELEIIAGSGIKPVIAIHDFKNEENGVFGYDSYNGQPFTFSWLKPLFDKIYGVDSYWYYYNTGVCEYSAKRGIIYLMPKI